MLCVIITYVNAAATSCFSLESPYVLVTPPRNSIRHAANDGVQ